MMVSWVRGQFESFTGNVNLDEEHPERSSVEITIDAASINTRQPDRDAHLKSADFLDVADYPTITFRSTRVDVTGRKTAKLHGDLTIRGVTKPVVLDVEFQGKVQNPFAPVVGAGFSAETKIDRKDWGLGWNMLVESGGLLVGDDIIVSVEMEVTQPVEEREAVPA
jgi:polyisoprenoid-binding protein YceI